MSDFPHLLQLPLIHTRNSFCPGETEKLPQLRQQYDIWCRVFCTKISDARTFETHQSMIIFGNPILLPHPPQRHNAKGQNKAAQPTRQNKGIWQPHIRLEHSKQNPHGDQKVSIFEGKLEHSM
ncbi:hypothetical protein FQZ97_979720 [compost metagenome]